MDSSWKFLYMRGFAFPSWGSGVTVPTSKKPKDDKENLGDNHDEWFEDTCQAT